MAWHALAMRIALLLFFLLAPQSQRSAPKATSQPQTQSAAAGNAQQPTAKHEPAESLWQRTFTDPVAFYTFVLAIFTGLLAVVSGVQISFLIRGGTIRRGKPLMPPRRLRKPRRRALRLCAKPRNGNSAPMSPLKLRR